MPSIAEDRRGISIGRVFAQAFAAIGSNPVTFFGLTLIFGVISVLITLFEGPRGLDVQQGVLKSGGTAAFVGLQSISVLVSVFLSMLVQGALVRATVAHAEGRRATIGESAAAGARAALPLFGLALLTALGVAIGMVLLIVPGVILYVMWSVAAPALVEEHRGVFDSFARSRALTKGARWSIFALELVILVILWIVSAVYGVLVIASFGVGGVADLAREGLPTGWLISQVLFSMIVTVFWSATQNSLYVELRRWKEGFTPERLADVFS